MHNNGTDGKPIFQGVPFMGFNPPDINNPKTGNTNPKNSVPEIHFSHLIRRGKIR